MDTPLPAPTQTLTPAETVHIAQSAKVLELMIEKSLTETEACKQVAIDRRTFQRTVARQDMLTALRAETEGTLAAAVSIALQGYLEGLEEMRRRIKSPITPAPALAKMTEMFGAVLQRFATVLPGPTTPAPANEPETPAAPKAVDVNFITEGPVTIHISAQDGVPVSGPVIAGTARPVEESASPLPPAPLS